MSSPLKSSALALFAIGVIGSGFGVSGFLDSRISFCDAGSNPCTSRTIPAGARVPEGAKFVRYEAGDVALKLFGSIVGLLSFGGCMVLCRGLAEQETTHQRFKSLSEEDAFRRYAAQQEADFEVFIRETNLRAAETAYTIMEPYQQAILEGDSLEEVNNPGDKLPPADTPPAVTETAQATEPPPPASKPEKPSWINGFLSSTCLVWGNQGGGKSWFVRYITLLKKQMGYKVIVFDPNSNRSEWLGVQLFNTYDQIEQQIAVYVNELRQRYEDFGKSDISEEEWRARLWKQGKALTIICEEMTTYADFIPDKELLSQFVKVATTLSRKQEMPVIFVTHNNTQSCMGDIKGLANLIGRMQQIQLIAATDEKTAQPVASGKAQIKLDGSNDWVEVLTPKLPGKIKDFRNATEKKGDERVYLERTWNLEFEISDRPNVPNQPKLSTPASVILKWLQKRKGDGSWLKYKGKEGRDGNFINFLSDNGIDHKARDTAIQELAQAQYIDHDDEKGIRLTDPSSDGSPV